MQRIRIGDTNFRIAIEGADEAPPLVLSNSLTTNLAMWDDQMPAFAAHFRVIRYDHRGHGGTDATPGPYSFDQLGRDALALMDALGIVRADWCGLSMGGMTGMWLLTHAPKRIGRAVLANTAAQIGDAPLWNGRIRTAERGGMAALADATIARWFTPDFIAQEPGRIEAVREMILTTPVPGYIGCCGAIRDMDQRDAIRAVTNPVLVVIGAHDPATTPEAGQLIARAIRGAETVTLPAAHLSNIECPQTFTRAALDFLIAGRGELSRR